MNIVRLYPFISLLSLSLLLLLLLVFIPPTLAKPDEYPSDEAGDGGSQEDNNNESNQDGGGNADDGGGDMTPPDNVEIVGGGAGDEPPTDPPPSTKCQYEELVKCLTEPLDEWSMALYNLKENIVAIKSEECTTHREKIRTCIEDKAPTLDCDHSNILSVAEHVTDLLTHKKKSGNWLRSYYVTAYVCTEEGRSLRDEVGEHCLKDERLGEMVFDAIRFMDEKFMANHQIDHQESCDLLRRRSHLMQGIGESKCNSHKEKAGRLLCETLKTAFTSMYPDKFKNQCQIDCVRHAAGGGANNGGGGNGGGGGENGGGGGGEDAGDAEKQNGVTGAQGEPGGTDQPTGGAAGRGCWGSWAVVLGILTVIRMLTD